MIELSLRPMPIAADLQFNEPWEARAFALTVSLHEAGSFSWAAFAAELGVQLRAADTDRPYYESWLTALERVLEVAEIAPMMTTTRRAEYLRGLPRPGHDHNHMHDHGDGDGDGDGDHLHESLRQRARPVAIA